MQFALSLLLAAIAVSAQANEDPAHLKAIIDQHRAIGKLCAMKHKIDQSTGGQTQQSAA